MIKYIPILKQIEGEKIMSKVLFVEDGSVDVDELQDILPEVPVIIYRAGSIKPEFVDVDTPVNVIKKEKSGPEGMCADKTFPVYTAEEIGKVIRQMLPDDGYDQLCIDAYNVDSFVMCIMQRLSAMKTESGADHSGDN